MIEVNVVANVEGELAGTMGMTSIGVQSDDGRMQE